MQWFLTCHTLRFGLPEDPANIRGMASKAGSIPSQAVSPSKRNSAQVTVARRQSIVAADDFFMLAQDQDGYIHLFNARKTEIQALSMEVKVQADARISHKRHFAIVGVMMEALYIKYLCPFKKYVTLDLIGGPRPLQFRYYINMQKGATFFFVLACMAYYDNWSWTAHVYLASTLCFVLSIYQHPSVDHGIYGFIWLLKDITVPDATWQVYLTIPSAIVAVVGLGIYWVAGYIVVAHRVEASPSLGAVCIMMNTLGSTLMLAADTQKYFALKYKKGLISYVVTKMLSCHHMNGHHFARRDGWVTWSRNTNYLGEMMLYLSFALLANHWIPYAWLAFNAHKRTFQEGGDAYMAKAGFLLPNVAGWAAASWSSAPKVVKEA
ncbi:hypothetical protein DYB26_008360 [Aphanomyces astaci]|uniref:Steroid 5-alpha reductase C-terminal domain-containing protein n=2 Tax=Aphanomyces astaci TaxID=112090 RepID=A0A418EDU2_APHAT|nr:hypothetical protein DYB26_008360 [Aphanomyces astaci]